MWQRSFEMITLYVDGLSTKLNMVVAHHCETVHCRDLTLESLCHFAKSQYKAYRASLLHIKNSFTSHQQGRILTHVGSNWTMSRQPRAANRPRTTNLNLMDTKEGAEEEDFREI